MIGCLLGIFVWPFHFLKWCFTNGWKGIITLLITVVILVVAGVMINNYLHKKTTPATADTTINIPTVKEAPYIVTTSSRYFYATKAVKDKDGTVTLTGYWELIKNKWVARGTLIITKSFGDVVIKKRTGG